MARLDRTMMDAATFPSVEIIPTRYADLDEQRHVNNAAVVVLLQEGRVRFNQNMGLRGGLGGLRLMVVALGVEYAAELHHPEPVELHSGIARIGRTSFTIAQRIRQHGRTGVYAESVMVLADANGPAEISDHLRGAFERLTLR
ncbi:acyl-CoA thioesterase [uncultured Sphingomonas sp.]|uniref:acyl-CoA thioesterase n=1 Tax=uncultured Sphingomonas sp. TaxID=158754 RepID=UPI0026377B10|nr:acyl-CoA thioesterase [uncultured Sphingomonas sp.]